MQRDRRDAERSDRRRRLVCPIKTKGATYEYAQNVRLSPKPARFGSRPANAGMFRVLPPPRQRAGLSL